MLTHTLPWTPSGSGLTWVDVLEQGLPDGVLQGACVLGGWEVFVRQVGLMGFPFEPGRTAGKKAAPGSGPCSHLQGSGHRLRAEGRTLAQGPLVPLLTSLIITLSFLILKMGTVLVFAFQVYREGYRA